MTSNVSNETPVAMLTVGQLKEVLGMDAIIVYPEQNKCDKRYVYGIRGIAHLFNCSMPTANRIKASGKIDGAITQLGRKIVVDSDLALELAGRKTGGRR